MGDPVMDFLGQVIVYGGLGVAAFFYLRWRFSPATREKFRQRAQMRRDVKNQVKRELRRRGV